MRVGYIAATMDLLLITSSSINLSRASAEAPTFWMASILSHQDEGRSQPRQRRTVIFESRDGSGRIFALEDGSARHRHRRRQRPDRAVSVAERNQLAQIEVDGRIRPSNADDGSADRSARNTEGRGSFSDLEFERHRHPEVVRQFSRGRGSSSEVQLQPWVRLAQDGR